jgi:hypothetical protein
MFKIKHILLSSVALCLFVATACEGEKELKVLSGKLPSKVKALYLVGNTTPNNPTWDIDKLDLLVQSEEDPYLWTYQGVLNPGTFKLCFRTGTWAQPFIHPMINEEPIGTQNVTDKKMQSPRQGGEDELWKVTDSGVYTLTFDLSDFTWSSIYEGEQPEEPLSNVYLLGNVTPNNPDWEINYPDQLIPSEDKANVYIYRGILNPGTFKLCFEIGTWAQPFVHPLVDGEEIGTETIVDRPMQAPRRDAPDELWKVTTRGYYTLSFNLGNNTYSSIYDGKVDEE